MTRVAARFAVSGTYMARICTLLNVPRPERGHWAKLAVGKAPPAPPLPEARAGDPLCWTQEGEPRPAARLPATTVTPARRTLGSRLRVPRSGIHGLIRGARTHFEHGRPVDSGAYLKPYKKLLVDVTASQPCLDRALDFANDLFNALESLGHRVLIAPAGDHLGRATIDEREAPAQRRQLHQYTGLWCPYRPTVVYVGDVAVGLAIIEMSEEVLFRYVNGRYIRDSAYKPPKFSRFADSTWTTTRTVPSGRLRLIAYSPYPRVDWSIQWQETKKALLRSTLRSIVESIESAAPELVSKLAEAERKAEIARQEWLEAQERRRRDEDRRRVEQSKRDSEQHLAQVIEQWGKVVNVERFLAGVEERAAELPEAERGPVLDRLHLAREFLGRQDPLDFFLSWRTPGERYPPIYRTDDIAEE
jgi:hypothetical protein